MLLMGDEVRRTQQGNNNAYCQDNEISWFDWSLVDRHRDMLGFVQKIIRFVQSLELFQQVERLDVATNIHKPYVVWHGVKLCQPDWGDNSHTVAFSLFHPDAKEYLHVLFNAYWEPLTFELPRLKRGEAWHRMIDTSLSSPYDACDRNSAPRTKKATTYTVEARSAVVLMAMEKRKSTKDPELD
jgi:isoamylase